jgi:hypothetical protein
MIDRWTLLAYLGNILFYSFLLRGLFCASVFSTRKHEFGELNSGLSVRVFIGSVRDALKRSSHILARFIARFGQTLSLDDQISFIVAMVNDLII